MTHMASSILVVGLLLLAQVVLGRLEAPQRTASRGEARRPVGRWVLIAAALREPTSWTTFDDSSRPNGAI
jgi:hypothetical protein